MLEGYLANFDASPDEVYANLVGPGLTCATDELLRVCVNDPEASLLVIRPLAEIPPTSDDHPNSSFDDLSDPVLQMVISWIDQGALRYLD